MDAEFGDAAIKGEDLTPHQNSRDDIAQLYALLANNMADLFSLFEKWDENHDGHIECEEFVRAMLELNLTSKRSVAEYWFDELDETGLGVLELQELKWAITAHRPDAATRIGAGAIDSFGAALSRTNVETAPVYKAAFFFTALIPVYAFVLYLVGDSIVYSQDPADWDVYDACARILTSSRQDWVKAICHLLMWPIIAAIVATAVHFAKAGAVMALGLKGFFKGIIHCPPSYSTGVIFVCVLELQTYSAAIAVSKPGFSPYTRYYFRMTFALLILIGWFAVLQKINSVIRAFVAIQSDFEQTSAARRAQMALVHRNTTWGVPDRDRAYSFSIRQNAPDVLVS